MQKEIIDHANEPDVERLIKYVLLEVERRDRNENRRS